MAVFPVLVMVVKWAPAQLPQLNWTLFLALSSAFWPSTCYPFSNIHSRQAEILFKASPEWFSYFHEHLAMWRSGNFLRNGRPVRKVEVVGVVVSVDRKESHLLFKLDDGTGCVPCVLWTNHNTSAYFSHLKEADRGLQAGTAITQANQVQLGHLLRVQGKISCFRSQLQVTVLSLVEEKDPNAEVLQWMQCMQLALRCYDLPFSPTFRGQQYPHTSK